MINESLEHETDEESKAMPKLSIWTQQAEAH